MFVVLKKKRLIAVIAGALAVLVLLLAASGSGAAAVFAGTASVRKLPIYCVDTPEPLIALTFDAAWGEDKTEKILDILQTNGVPATFFLTGFWMDKNSELINIMDGQGIEIGTHGDTHAHMNKLSYEKQREELLKSSKKITDITGTEVNLFRPPFGEYNDNLIKACGNVGLNCIQWDVDSLDWMDKPTAVTVNHVVARCKNGSIVLFHTNSLNIESALPVLISALKNKGLKFSTVSNLIYKDNWYIDSTGVQRKKTI